MAFDQNGKSVNFGDYVIVEVALTEVDKFCGIVRIVKLSETPRGVGAVGAFVDLVGQGRVRRVTVDLSTAKLVLRADGSAVS